MKKVLHVGCGRKSIVGHFGVFRAGEWAETKLDIEPSVEPDIVASMTDMAMVADASHDAVFSSHNLEHLFPHELRLALEEFRRVLTSGGFLLVLVPDIQKAAAAIAAGDWHRALYESDSGPITPLDVLYGHRASIARGQPHMAHRNGFVISSLLASLEAAGFAGVHAKRSAYDLVAMAYKDRRPAESPYLNGLWAPAPTP